MSVIINNHHRSIFYLISNIECGFSCPHVSVCVLKKKNAIKQVDKGREAESALHI